MAWAERMSSGRYRGRYYDNAGQVQSVIDGKVGFKYQKDAEEAAQEAEVRGRRKAAVEAGTQSARITWSQLRELFVDSKRGKPTETEFSESYPIRLFIEPRWGDVPINQIQRKRVQAWINNDIKPGKKPSYVHRIYQIFAAPLNWAVEEEILDATPCTKITLPTITKEPKPYMDDDYIAVIGQHLSENAKLAMEFQYETGLRPGELGGLHIHRIDRRLKILTVADVFVGRLKLMRPYTKNGDVDEIPITTRALEILDEVLLGRNVRRGCGVPHHDGRKCRSDVVFRTVRDKPLDPRNYYALLVRAAERAGVELKSPYAGRRGFATRLAENGVGIFDIAASMRHGVDQTPGYVQKTPAFLDRIRVALGDSPQLTVVEGRGARGAARGADHEKHPSTSVDIDGGENVG